MTDPTYELIREETLTTTHYDPPSRTEKITRHFDVEGSFIFSKSVGHQKRTRRFKVTRIEVMWSREIGEGPWRRRWTIARGPTVLANGQESTRSTGFHCWWARDLIPDHLARLHARHDSDIGVSS